MESSEEILITERQKELAAKREARRKRILENTNNRLEKITGRTHDEEMDNFEIRNDPIIYPDPDIEREVFERSSPPMPQFDMFNNQSNMFNNQNNMFNNQDMFRVLEETMRAQQGQTFSNTSSSPQAQQNVKQSNLVKLLKTKIHIAFISILIYILFVTENQNYTSNSVFFYLLIWEFAEVFLLKTYETKNNFIGIVFLLGGVPMQHFSHITKIIETIYKILKDVAIFVFFFVASHIFWQSIFLGKNFNEIIRKEDNFERL